MKYFGEINKDLIADAKYFYLSPKLFPNYNLLNFVLYESIQY